MNGETRGVVLLWLLAAVLALGPLIVLAVLIP